MDDIPCSFHFSSIRNTIRYLCTLTPTPHFHPSSPMNSLRPFFRLLFASTRLSLFVLFSLWVWDIGYCHITSNHYKHKTVHTSHNDGVVVLMDIHEIRKSLFGVLPKQPRFGTNKLSTILFKELPIPNMDTVTIRTCGPDEPGLRAFPITGAITGVPVMVVAYCIVNAP